MEEALAKIRPHVSSRLAHQKTPAALLHALEATLREQHKERTPTAYFSSLLTTLDGVLQKGSAFGEGDVLPAVLYLLALISPFVPAPVVRAQLPTLLSLTAPLYPSLIPHAPPLRSQLGLYHAIFFSLDLSSLETHGLRQSFASVLQLCLDARPKVRKKAADLVKEVLASPPPPMKHHPYAEMVAKWVESSLAEINNGITSRKGSAKGSDTDMAIHLLAFLRPIINDLPSSTLPSIINSLIFLPRLGNPYLSDSAYSILSDLFESSGENVDASQVSAVLHAILTSTPSKSDQIVAPVWLQVVGRAMLTYGRVDANACSMELSTVWSIVWPFLESSDRSIRTTAAQSLDLLAQCITPASVAAAVQGVVVESTAKLGSIIAQSTMALESLAYASAVPEVFAVLSSLILNLRYRETRTSPTGAELLLLPTIRKVGELRTSNGFEYVEAADSTLAAAMRVLGPHVLLSVLPLNVEPADRNNDEVPRAYLLPLLVDPHPSPLAHFTSYFLPLSKRFFDLQQKAESGKRASEAKVWAVLIAQIWAGLAGYCWGTIDLRQSFTPAFSQILSQLLYTQPDLRPAVLKALRVVVESNVTLASSAVDESNPHGYQSNISPNEAALNLAFLQTQTESWLSVLFNVFGSVDKDGRGMVGDVISAWAGIAQKEEISKACEKIMEILKQNLVKGVAAPHGDQDGSENLIVTMQDLLFLLLPYLTSLDATALFHLCFSPDILGNGDNGVQKRGYKILAKLISMDQVAVEVDTILRKLEIVADSIAPAAKKDRFTLLTSLIPRIPTDALHVIPSLIPEAILGTKEPSEKARTAAFNLIVAMGEKMKQGGIVKKDMIDGLMEDGTSEATANIEEYMKMVAGGLAGATPHMVSAAVTAVSRLVFEFKDDISPQMHDELFTTMLVFVSSTNREIVKATLGFIKLAIHTLPVDLIHPHLKEVVSALLAWSNDHKNHFKTKVRHIFERMIRRLGWENVYACAGEEESAKVLVNIKKRKDRAKRKKARLEGEEGREEMPSSKHTTGDAFEDVLFGSESELDEDDEQEGISHVQRRAIEHGARLRIDNDEPMDLLQGATSRVTTARTNARRRQGQDAARFKTDKDTGKMIIDGESDGDDEKTPAERVPESNAYLESMVSVEGFTRGPHGRVKFNKDTKKRRREQENLDGDVEMENVESSAKSKQSKPRKGLKPGHEFKAKRAGGDIKRGGFDPYAYVPLAQAAKKTGRGGHGRVGIVGRT